MIVNLSKFRATNHNKWLNVMMRMFAEDHDIQYGTKVREYCGTPPGARAFTAWLKHRGFKVEYWCLEPLTVRLSPSEKIVDYLGFGFSIDENCPLFIETKLKA